MSELKSTTSGMIEFGMVSVPVRFYAAVSEKSVSFKNRHKGCSSPVQAPRYCPDCDTYGIAQDAMEKCFEVSKTLVALSDEELANLPRINSKAITIEGFTGHDETPYVAVEKSYYLGPDDRLDVGHKAFALLRAALRVTGKTAVAKLARSNKEQIATITAVGDVLQIDYLYWSEEMNDHRNVPMPQIEVSDAEVAMAVNLIEAMPDGDEILNERVDGFKAAVVEVVNAKLEGKVLEMPAKPAAPAKTDDLAAMLQASVAALKKEKVA